jgi:fumarate hydratase subunit alpha
MERTNLQYPFYFNTGGSNMRELCVTKITETVAALCKDANFRLGQDVLQAYERALQMEESETGKEILHQIIENSSIAKNEQVPSCQDTGVAVFFIEVGQEVHVIGGNLYEAIEKGVERGYAEGYLRKSMCDPFTRKNTKTNLPAIVHTEIVPGETLKITIAPKGGGSENMSTVIMMKPAEGEDGVVRNVVDWVKKTGPNPCPPIVVGVGIGGNFERCAYLAKKALIRPIGQRHIDPKLAGLEEKILGKINELGIGPMGLGGRITAFDVHIEYMPCHIASMPLGINIQCHASRHKEAII